MYAKTQTLEGVTNKIKNSDKFYVFWDLEKCTLEEAKATLKSIQTDYDLGDIFIFSDVPNSFRAWCFTPVDFHIYLQILLDTEFVDYNFFYWTVKQGKATLRISKKEDRPKQQLLTVLKRRYESIPQIVEYVKYDTGTRGHLNVFINVGEKA
jgi:hypothetical protein